uniref:Copper-containing nitrite reductase n=1 Tax=Ascaris lumbricoides TaxID=6252 RepID=A0A0M3IU54_ASCLU
AWLNVEGRRLSLCAARRVPDAAARPRRRCERGVTFARRNAQAIS